MSDIESRIRRIEDRLDLQDLVTRYFIAADDDEYETIGELFAENGIFTAPGFVGGTNRAEVIEFVKTDRANMGPTVHTPDYSLFEFQDDDHASGVVGAHLELARGGTTLFGAVRYHDNYVREGGKWRFARRELLTIHVGPWDDVGTSLTEELNVRWPGFPAAPSHFPKKQT